MFVVSGIDLYVVGLLCVVGFGYIYIVLCVCCDLVGLVGLLVYCWASFVGQGLVYVLLFCLVACD